MGNRNKGKWRWTKELLVWENRNEGRRPTKELLIWAIGMRGNETYRGISVIVSIITLDPQRSLWTGKEAELRRKSRRPYPGLPFFRAHLEVFPYLFEGQQIRTPQQAHPTPACSFLEKSIYSLLLLQHTVQLPCRWPASRCEPLPGEWPSSGGCLLA